MRPFQCSTAGRSPEKGAMSYILSAISTLIFGHARSGVRDNLSGGLHSRGLRRALPLRSVPWACAFKRSTRGTVAALSTQAGDRPTSVKPKSWLLSL